MPLAGVVLIQSLQLTGFFQYGVRLVADTENIFTSVERIQAYGNLPSEADPNSPPGLISDQWPEKGEVEFVEYTLAYRTDLPAVLNKLSFKVICIQLALPIGNLNLVILSLSPVISVNLEFPSVLQCYL